MTQVFSPASPTSQPANPAPIPVNVEAPPSLSDSELVGRMRALFAKARSHRRPTVNQWVKNYRVMRNRTWMTSRPEWMPSPEVPEMRPIVASWTSWLTDQRPQFDFTASAQPYSPFAAFYETLAMDMKTAANIAWHNYGWETQIQMGAFDAAQYSIGVFKTTWDNTLADGLGDVRVSRLDPFTLYPDPASTCAEDANYFIEARQISVQELDRRFPGAAKKFEVYGYTDQIDAMPDLRQGASQTPRANPGAIAPATTPRYGLPGQARERAEQDDTGVTLLECWLREHSYDDKTQKTYECWRVVCIAGPYVLMNKRADEIFPFKTHPYDFFSPENMGEFYGQSLVELLTSSQLAINRLLASMMQNVDLTGNPIFKEGSRSGMQRTRMSNRPGQRITVAENSTAEWLPPPQLSAEMPGLVQFFKAEMRDISGLADIARGSVPGGRNSTDVLDTVLEAGFVRIRMAQRNLEWAIRGIGTKVAAFISEFYTEPRFVATVGPQGGNSAKIFRARHFYLPNEDGVGLPLRFNVMVRAGSMLPTTRNNRIAEADTLYAMGGIDRPALLEAHDVPNRDQIVARIAEMEAKGTFAPPGARQRSRK